MAEEGRGRSSAEVAASEASVGATASCWCWCWCWCSWASSALRFRKKGTTGCGEKAGRSWAEGLGGRRPRTLRAAGAVGIGVRARAAEPGAAGCRRPRASGSWRRPGLARVPRDSKQAARSPRLARPTVGSGRAGSVGRRRAEAWRSGAGAGSARRNRRGATRTPPPPLPPPRRVSCGLRQRRGLGVSHSASRSDFAKRRLSAASACARRYLPLRAASTPFARTAGPCAPPRTSACPSSRRRRNICAWAKREPAL